MKWFDALVDWWWDMRNPFEESWDSSFPEIPDDPAALIPNRRARVRSTLILGDFDDVRASIPAPDRPRGGYVNHPSDPGGETNFGITKRSYPAEDIRA